MSHNLKLVMQFEYLRMKTNKTAPCSQTYRHMTLEYFYRFLHMYLCKSLCYPPPQEFPVFSSSSLTMLYLQNNPLGSVPLDAFANAPSLYSIFLYNTQLDEVLAGTVSHLSYSSYFLLYTTGKENYSIVSFLSSTFRAKK